MSTSSKLNTWSKNVFTWMFRYPFAALLGLVVIVGGGALLLFGFKVNVGGILNSLFGRKGEKADIIETANSIPEKRVDKDGKEIPKGVPDEKGYTQWDVHSLEKNSNPFRDRNKITITKQDGTKADIELPKGIKDSEIDTIIEVKPDVYVLKTSKQETNTKELLEKLPPPS